MTALYIWEIPSAEHWERDQTNPQKRMTSVYLKKKNLLFCFPSFHRNTMNFWVASDLSSIILLSLADCYSHSTTKSNFSSVPDTSAIIGCISRWPHLSKVRLERKSIVLSHFQVYYLSPNLIIRKIQPGILAASTNSVLLVFLTSSRTKSFHTLPSHTASSSYQNTSVYLLSLFHITWKLLSLK